MEPQDILWRIFERFNDQLNLLEESHTQLDPKKHSDVISAIEECERLTRTQQNIINRLRRRYG